MTHLASSDRHPIPRRVEAFVTGAVFRPPALRGKRRRLADFTIPSDAPIIIVYEYDFGDSWTHISWQ